MIPLNYRSRGEAHGQAVYTLLAALGASQVSVSSNLEATFLEGQSEERGYKDTYSTKAGGPRGAGRARGARISRGPRFSISATRSRGTLGRKRKRHQCAAVFMHGPLVHGLPLRWWPGTQRALEDWRSPQGSGSVVSLLTFSPLSPRSPLGPCSPAGP